MVHTSARTRHLAWVCVPPTKANHHPSRTRLTFGEMFILKTIGLDQSIREPTPLPPPQGGGMRTLPTETCGPPPLPPTRSSGLISPTDHGSQGMRNQAKQGLARHRFSYLKLRSRPRGQKGRLEDPEGGFATAPAPRRHGTLLIPNAPRRRQNLLRSADFSRSCVYQGDSILRRSA